MITLRILLIFLGMLALNRLGLPLGAALIAGGVALDISAGHGTANVLHDLGGALATADIWLMLLVTALLLEYGRLLGSENNARAILSAARQWGGRHGRAFSLMIIPAAIGLVPMPGGALVSAPLVDKAAHETSWPAEWKSAVNYWFRHVWEYWWPIFPVAVVTLSIFHVPMWQYMLTLIPFSAVALAAGYLFLVRPHLAQLATDTEPSTVEGDKVRTMMISLALVVLASLFLPSAIAQAWPATAGQIGKMLAMTAGMAMGLFYLIARDKDFRIAAFWRDLKSAKSAHQLATIGGVMIFQHLLDTSGLLPRAGAELAHSGIPVACIVALLPLLAGVITGVAAGFAGMAFPLVVGLMNSPASGLTPSATLVLAFGFGYAGMMLSPVHLCLVLTREYFSAPLRFIYRLFLPCVFALLASAVLLFLAYDFAGI